MYLHEFKDQLRKQASHLSFEEINYLINAFVIEHGYIEAHDFYLVMKKVKEKLINHRTSSVK